MFLDLLWSRGNIFLDDGVPRFDSREPNPNYQILVFEPTANPAVA